MKRRKPRANVGMSRQAWREHKAANGIKTRWDRQTEGLAIKPLRDFRFIRTEAEIRADAARMLTEQLTAQRERWGFI